ncbi:MAG TPA: hypothetical protein VFT74_03145, partial [Isosphaeraceae bacterium]|nr:hypothetical protein [Isosphaeraceae bacterium]
PVAEYAPDLPSLAGAATILNVLPRTPQSYGPMAGQSVFSTNALDARCQGAISGTDSAGNVSVFSGTASKLYRMTVADSTFSDVSKTGGYACPADENWRFILYGSRLIAMNISDPIQNFVIGTDSAFSDLSSGAPKARYGAVVKGWLMVANTNDGTDGAQLQRVWWSALNDPTNWPTPGTSTAAEFQSDHIDLAGPGGEIQGIVGNLGTADAAVFLEHEVWRVVNTAPPVTFDFFPAEGLRGTPAPGSIVQLGSLVYFLAEDGFYVFDGTMSRPIGANKIDKTFYADVDQSFLYKMKGAVDPINKLIFWVYQSLSANGNPDKCLVYNWSLDRWSLLEFECETIFRALSFGFNLDTLDNTGYNVDTLPVSLDSRVWTGGKVLMASFDTSHKLNYFTGDNLAPTVDTPEMQPIPGLRCNITNSRPIVDGGTPSVTIGVRERQVDSVSFGSASALDSTGQCPVRTSGRYARARITLPAASPFTHISGIELDVSGAGAR